MTVSILMNYVLSHVYVSSRVLKLYAFVININIRSATVKKNRQLQITIGLQYFCIQG